MKDLANIKKITIEQDSVKVNNLLDGGWILLEIGNMEGYPFFILGLDDFYSSMESVCGYEGTY